MHPLANAVWHALTGPHETVAERSGLAARYPRDVSPMAALADVPTVEAWEALRSLVGAGNIAMLFREELAVPPGWEQVFRVDGLQMVRERDGAEAGDTAAARRPAAPIVELSDVDVDAMLALVERTRPGPFERRTIELGCYLGIQDHGALVAMAGERLRIAGHTEVSAVCTDAEHRGRGLAGSLVTALVDAIAARGEVPFLHVAVDNLGAIRLYEALGFRASRHVQATGIRVPA